MKNLNKTITELANLCNDPCIDSIVLTRDEIKVIFKTGDQWAEHRFLSADLMLNTVDFRDQLKSALHDFKKSVGRLTEDDIKHFRKIIKDAINDLYEE